MKSAVNTGIARVWELFEEICRIPRPSKSEERMIEYLLSFADKQKLEARKDDIGNVLICKPASPGMENSKKVILQSHLDMVGEKDPSSSHDFTSDPIVPVRDGEWIRATDTTLGADDGIGIASQMAILESKELIHPPLECLFTVDEESGMTGAKNLHPDFLNGEILINLDSEDEGELFIGCAGGIDTIGTFRFQPQKPCKDCIGCRVSVEGFKGGHSGDEIHISPGNAIKVLNRFLLLESNDSGVRLSSFDGGNMRNAIPRDAYALLTLPARLMPDLEKQFNAYANVVSAELADFEPDMKLSLDPAGIPEYVLPEDAHMKILEAIDCCPHGVIGWSRSLEGLVETSTNLASVKHEGRDTFVVTTSQRSSVDRAKKEIAARIRACFENGGAQVEHSDGYPGWDPNPDSEILRITKQAYLSLFGSQPVVRAIHAGLECGLILEKYPGLDMLSFGPTIRGAHTPTERIHLESTERFWKLLLELLRRIPAA